MAREIAGGKDGHEQEPEDDEPSIAGREAHGLCDRGRRHPVVVFAHGVVAAGLTGAWLVKRVVCGGGRYAAVRMWCSRFNIRTSPLHPQMRGSEQPLISVVLD